MTVVRAAFTLVELLVVITVMAILVGLIIAAAAALGVGSKKTRSATILETVRQAMEVTGAQSGSVTSAVEHPLAGSYGAPGEPRFRFVRAAAPHSDLARTVNGALGTESEQIALSGVGLGELAAGAHARLLLPDDIYADHQVPLLYGLARERIGVLGAKLAAVTRFRRLPKPVPGQVIAQPDDLGAYPNAVRLVSSDVQPDGNKPTLDYILGSTNATAELAKLGALFAPEDDPLHRHAYGRVWCEQPRTGSGEPLFKPGRFNDPERVPLSSPSWKRYRLRGLAIYDAWGVEIICSTAANGAVRLMSAGKDGAFRWDPGLNGALETDAWATGPAGDDKDGSRDNVVSNVGGG